MTIQVWTVVNKDARIASLTEAVRVLSEALDELRRCSNAIVGADVQDPDAEEAFTMYWAATHTARAALTTAKELTK